MTCDNWLLYLAGLFASLAAVRCETEIYRSNHSIAFRGENSNSLFGYSVAYQEQLKMLVIGSPKEDPVGQVHLCTIEKANCERVYRDNIKLGKYDYWFGATVNAGQNFFMACAPRYTTSVGTAVSTRGRCYYADTPNAHAKPNVKKPLSEFTYDKIAEKDRQDYYQEAYGEKSSKTEHLSDTLGLSSYVYDKRTIFLGGPAMSIGRVSIYANNENVLMKVPKNTEDEKMVSYNFGYSITSGFFQPGDAETIAISSPYGTIGHGRVYFYDNDVKELKNNVWVESEGVTTVGSLFGASLASLKLKDDTRRASALLVGAPAFANTKCYDLGAVFIYTFDIDFNKYNPVLIKTVLPATADDYRCGGRFGASIVTIGDFDNDDVEEVAVAAPFENNGRGAVYIYSGSLLLAKDTGLRVPYMQLLRPEESIFSYGLALTAPNDADNNGCNELAIGAPVSGSVTFWRCMASVRVDFDKKRDVHFPDLAEQYLELAHTDTAFKFSLCVNIIYNEKSNPEGIETNVEFTIKIIHPNVTIESGDNNGTMKTRIETLKHNSRTKPKLICYNDLQILLPKDADYDQEVMFDLSLSLENPQQINEFNPNLVLLNGKTKYSENFPGPKLPASDVTFTVETTLKENYVIGSTDDERLVITMENSGQSAHRPCVRARLNGVTVSKTDRECSVANGELKCQVEKLRSGEKVKMTITLAMKSLTSSDDRLKLFFELFKSDCRIPAERNHTTIINLTADANVMIKNSSIPSFNVNATKEELSSKGKIIEHVYKITNNGFTVWRNLSCEIVLPPQVKIEKVTVKSTIKENCVIANHTAYCHITELGKNKPIDIRIQMKIVPGSPFGDKIKSGKVTVDTKLSLKLADTMLARITTIVSLWEAPKVPLWMIIVAALVGILLIVILLWALHECGCLNRQNKQKLKELKKEVHRQTMRKSMMLRQSVIEVIANEENKGDRERLIQDAVSNSKDNQDHKSTPIAKDINGQHTKDISDVQQTPQAKDLLNAHPVKEICIDDNDPARVAFNAELAKALAKGGKPVVTEAEIH